MGLLSQYGSQMSSQISIALAGLCTPKANKNSEYACKTIIYLSRMLDTAKFVEDSMPNLEGVGKKVSFKNYIIDSPHWKR